MLEKQKLAQLVNLNCQDMCFDSSNQMKQLAGLKIKKEEEDLNIEIFAAQLYCKANTLISCWGNV